MRKPGRLLHPQNSMFTSLFVSINFPIQGGSQPLTIDNFPRHSYWHCSRTGAGSVCYIICFEPLNFKLKGPLLKPLKFDIETGWLQAGSMRQQLLYCRPSPVTHTPTSQHQFIRTQVSVFRLLVQVSFSRWESARLCKLNLKTDPASSNFQLLDGALTQ